MSARAYTPAEFQAMVIDAGGRINDAMRDDSILISLCAVHMIRAALLSMLSDQTDPTNALTLENYNRFVEFHSQVHGEVAAAAMAAVERTRRRSN